MFRNAFDAVTDLRERGFIGFELSDNDLLKTKEKMFLQADKFVILESHRFCMPSGKDADIIVHGLVILGSSARGILISHCTGGTIVTNNAQPINR